MFAFLAAIVFFLDLVKVKIGTVDMVVLGLLLIALHLAVGGPVIPSAVSWRRTN